jgi:hypothetical protein
VSKPTPGPWRATHRHTGGPFGPDVNEMGGLGWVIEGPPEASLRGQFARGADAFLVAAAPDLLAACEAALPCLEDPADAEVLKQVQAAISGARGEW